MVPVVIAIFVVIVVLHFVTVFIRLVAISISIAGLSNVVGRPPVIAVMIVPPAVISVMIISLVPYDAIIAEPRVIAEARFVLASPFPIFPLPLTVEPVVLDIVITTLGQPLPVIWVIRAVIAAIPSVSGIRTVLITVLRASGRHDCPQSQG
jgi:hypothetical protein